MQATAGSCYQRGPCQHYLMNLRRIAALLRELADEIDPGEPKTSKATPVKKPPRPRRFPPPLNPVSEEDVERARKMLRRRGMIP